MVKNYLSSVYKKLNEFFLFKSLRQKSINYLNFRNIELKKDRYKAFFFLSSGRTGTKFFTVLLNFSSKVKAFHSPMNLFCFSKSELIEQGRVAYEFYRKKGFDDKELNILLAEVFLAAREDLLYSTYLYGKIYIETNNRITFLAPAIKFLIPNAKFIHLYRHPGEFIRSGIRRGYYKSNSQHELGRLKPLKGSKYYDVWERFDDIQKIAWLWNETNLFIEDYLSTMLNKNDYFKFDFTQNLNVENIKRLLNFLDIVDISEKTIENLIKKPINIQKKGSFPKYEDWFEENKEKVRKICGKLAEKYGYQL